MLFKRVLSLIAVGLVSATAVLAGCGRPITVQALIQDSGMPVEDVRIYRYRFSIFSLFPTKKSVQTGPDGRAEIMVGPTTTNLTMLCQGFEPVLVGVFEQESAAVAPDAGGYNYVLRYDTLESKQVVPVEFHPVRREPLDLHVTDRATNKPIVGAEIFAATFLYLPQPGVEKDWGFPPLQQVETDAAGSARVDQVSGFRNRVTIRKKSYQDAVLDIDGKQLIGPASRAVELRPLSVKQIDFLVIDAKTRAPIANAEVKLGDTRDGLPLSPDAWVKNTDAAGRTGLMPTPDAETFLVSVKARGYEDWRGAPVWRALTEGQTKRLEITKK